MSTRHLHPLTNAEAVAALTVKPRSPYQTRYVKITSAAHKRNYADRTIDVVGPTGPDDALYIDTYSGIVNLRVLSGNVRISLGSSWGNPVEIMPEAAATTTVEVITGRKATITGDVRREALSGDLARAYWPTKWTYDADGSRILTDSLASA